MTCSPLFVVLAFRYGGHENTFPIGVFSNRLAAEIAAKEHHDFRGGKYDHRVYEFLVDKWDDDVGHAGNHRLCIEANKQLLQIGNNTTKGNKHESKLVACHIEP